MSKLVQSFESILKKKNNDFFSKQIRVNILVFFIVGNTDINTKKQTELLIKKISTSP